MKPILFIDRDGVILEEPKSDYQIDSIQKTSFIPGAISYLGKIANEFGFHKVMVTNQDGLGTASYPMESFEPFQSLMLRTLGGEGFVFDEIFIDDSLVCVPKFGIDVKFQTKTKEVGLEVFLGAF